MAQRCRQDFKLYVRRLADLLGLHDWQFLVPEDQAPSDPEQMATVAPWPGRRWATIRLSERFLNEDPEEQRYVVCHELIHCHLAAAGEFARDQMSRETFAGFEVGFEYGIDALACALAPHLPRPAAVLNEKPPGRSRAKPKRKTS